MVSLSTVRASNSLISDSLPQGLVAVFIGATSGIGEDTMKAFAKHAVKPRVYFTGRSEEAALRIEAECRTLNGEGEFKFIIADTSLIKEVDRVCKEIKEQESAINLLFISAGTLVRGVETKEGLHLPASLAVYSRTRFIVNLLPLIQRATSLRRVISTFAATTEGPILTSDFQARNPSSVFAARGHATSMVTLSLEALAEKAPNVSFIHNFPGVIKTGISRGTSGVLMWMMWLALLLFERWICMPHEECGERHLFLATSARYPARHTGLEADEGAEHADGVPLPEEAVVGVARGTDGKIGSGIYSLDEKGESAGAKAEKTLAGLREEGMVQKVWEEQAEQFKRITGSDSLN